MIAVHISHSYNQQVEQILKEHPECSIISHPPGLPLPSLQTVEKCILITDQLPPDDELFPTENTIFLSEDKSFRKAIRAINSGAIRYMEWGDKECLPLVIQELLSLQTGARNLTEPTRVSCLNALLTPNIPQTFASKMIGYAGIQMQWNSYSVWVLEVVSVESNLYKYEQLVCQILKILSSFCYLTKVLFLQDQEKIIGYAQNVEQFDKGDLSHRIQYVISQIESVYQCMIRFGMGKTVHKNTQLYQSYQSALHHSVFDLALRTSHAMSPYQYKNFPERHLNSIDLITYIGEKICQNKPWQPEFDQIIQILAGYRGILQDWLKFYYLDLVYQISRILINEGFLPEKEQYPYLIRFYQINTLRNFKMITEDFFAAMAELVQSKTLTHSQTLIAKAKRYIELHYQYPDLNLQNVAEDVHINSQYLSRLFKKEMGISFVEYVRSYRIEKSLVLLKDGNFSIETVALKVGYRDTKYFSFCFKKKNGVSPLNYRKNIEINEKNY